ncbi:MAG: hypothetical protein KJO24_00945 [Gammaproteobacteria bacterium]|nr:hypothetical protein [Gammaproteobacteria bacterium]
MENYMIVIATVLSWALLQYQVALDALHRDDWLESWSAWVASYVAPSAGSRVATLLTLLVPVATLAIVLALFGNWLLGLLGFAINVAALLYACGRGDYEQSCERHIFALQQEGSASQASPVEAWPALRASLNYLAYERWFPVVFWFLLLGAPGALFYRLLACYAQPEASVSDTEAGLDNDGESERSQSLDRGEIHRDAQSLLGWFDWLPVRLWALACALAGNFSAAFESLRSNIAGLQSTYDLLDDVVVAAADVAPGMEPLPNDSAQCIAALRQCCQLNRRVMVVTLVFVLLVIIIL